MRVRLETKRLHILSPTGPATFHSLYRLIMNLFSAILSLPLIQEGQLSVSGERICIKTG